MKTNCQIDHEIICNGFSPLVQTPGLFLCIVIENWGGQPTYSVYMRHGSPGGQFWRSGEPVRREASLTEAQQWVNKLAGLCDAHKKFPVFQSNRLGEYHEVHFND